MRGQACGVAAKQAAMERKARQQAQQARRRRRPPRRAGPVGRVQDSARRLVSPERVLDRSLPDASGRKLGRSPRVRRACALTSGSPASSGRSAGGSCFCRAGGRRRSPPSRPDAPCPIPSTACSSWSAPSRCAAPAAPTTTSSTGTSTPRSRAPACARSPRARSRPRARWPSWRSSASSGFWSCCSSTASRSCRLRLARRRWRSIRS